MLQSFKVESEYSIPIYVSQISHRVGPQKECSQLPKIMHGEGTGLFDEVFVPGVTAHDEGARSVHQLQQALWHQRHIGEAPVEG